MVIIAAVVIILGQHHNTLCPVTMAYQWSQQMNEGVAKVYRWCLIWEDQVQSKQSSFTFEGQTVHIFRIYGGHITRPGYCVAVLVAEEDKELYERWKDFGRRMDARYA